MYADAQRNVSSPQSPIYRLISQSLRNYSNQLSIVACTGDADNTNAS